MHKPFDVIVDNDEVNPHQIKNLVSALSLNSKK
jgi:hypothetical protein